jgi:hypothetical protein
MFSRVATPFPVTFLRGFPKAALYDGLGFLFAVEGRLCSWLLIRGLNRNNIDKIAQSCYFTRDSSPVFYRALI